MEKEFFKIGCVAGRYGISTRTLRYYEEAGLLESIRNSTTQSRYYDPEAMARLKRIIILKQGGLTIDEIRDVFASRESALRICRHKLQHISEMAGMMQAERQILQEFVVLLMQESFTLDDSIDALHRTLEHDHAIPPIAMKKINKIGEEDFAMKKLSNEEVRLVTLNPMRVACYHAVSEHPENDAYDVMMKWARDNGIDRMPHTRYFGYDMSSPGPGNPVYGYEVCVTIEEDVKPAGSIGEKTLAGGLYAVTSLYGYDIPVAWKRLMTWIAESPYEPEWPRRQCLEEHFPNNRELLAEKVFQLDLYEPVRKK